MELVGIAREMSVGFHWMGPIDGERMQRVVAVE